MKPTVYLETTIIGYLAMRVSGVLRVAANQQTTRVFGDNYSDLRGKNSCRYTHEIGGTIIV